MNVSAVTASVKSGAYTAVNDTVADIDEEEYIASKDPAKLSRINRAQQEGQLNARDYIIENRFLPRGDKFVSNSFWDHFYFMAGFGIEKLSAVENYNIGNINTAHFGFGKDFSERSTVRMYGNIQHSHRALTDGKFSNYMMANGNVDYMYNLSAYLAGYNPKRAVNVSMFAGLGFGGTKSSQVESYETSGFKLSGNLHVGLSFNIYGGPRSYFAIEPYIGVGTDQMDNSYKRNWHKYDIFYGVRGTYAYYLRPNIGQDAYNRIFSDWHYAGLTETEKLRVWQNPYFIELQAGPSMGNPGHNLGVYAGKWFSPAFGMRMGLYGRNAEYQVVDLPTEGDGSVYPLSNRYTYTAFRVEGLVNPFGFGRYYDWNRIFGAYITGGLSIGRLDIFNNGANVQQENVINFETGAHAWLTLDKGIQFFVEPHFTHYESNAPVKKWATDINFGMTITSEARKYREHFLPEEMPIYDNIPSRLTFGLGFGRVFRQQASYAYDGEKQESPIHNFTLFGEYRLSNYYSVRLGLEYLNLYDVTGRYSDVIAATPDKFTSGDIINHTTHLAMINLDPVFHLAPLMRGVDPYRKWNIDLAAGVTFSWLTGETSKTLKNAVSEGLPKTPGDIKVGANANMRLSYKVTDQASIFLIPALYFVKNVKYGHASPDYNGWQFFQTVNVGMQYALAAPKKLSAFEDSLNIDRWRNPWFIEASAGAVISKADDQAGIGSKKLGMGYNTSFSFGKWFAPIMGFRASAVRRSSEWGYYDWGETKGKHGTEFFNENFIGGRLDVLVNPMGFFNDFTWDDPWGIYGFVGFSYGQKRMHRSMTNAVLDGRKVDDSGDKSCLSQAVTSLNFGIHPWLKLSDDLSIFLEYLYTTTNSERPSAYSSWVFDDASQGRHTISLGLSMLVRTAKYRGLRDISAFYNFKPWVSSRLRFGISGGFNQLHGYKGHTSETSTLAGFISGFQGMAFGEYRISDYFAGRLTYEYAIRNNIQKSGASSPIHLVSGSFNANLTTIMGGFRRRTTELDVFLGPTMFFQSKKNLISGNAAAADEIGVGGHVGLRASRFIDEAHQTAIFFQPTIYVLKGGGQESFIGRFSLMQTINIGVHYTLR